MEAVHQDQDQDQEYQTGEFMPDPVLPMKSGKPKKKSAGKSKAAKSGAAKSSSGKKASKSVAKTAAKSTAKKAVKSAVKSAVKAGGKKEKPKGKKSYRRLAGSPQLPPGQAVPTRDGEPFKSSWKSRTHMRSAQSKTASVLCQRKTKSGIWRRDLISVPPGRDKEVSCRRCKRVMKAQA